MNKTHDTLTYFIVCQKIKMKGFLTQVEERSMLKVGGNPQIHHLPGCLEKYR